MFNAPINPSHILRQVSELAPGPLLCMFYTRHHTSVPDALMQVLLRIPIRSAGNLAVVVLPICRRISSRRCDSIWSD